MQYALLLKAHPNEHYRQAQRKLGRAELCCCLNAFGYSDILPFFDIIYGREFLCFHLPESDEALLNSVNTLSCVALAAERPDDALLKPLCFHADCHLPEELPHVLKYKGKTNADFTTMMIHCALYLSDFANSSQRLSLIDPMCGKATTLFCGGVAGMDTVGLDVNRKELHEADSYLEKSLQMHRISYNRREESRTLRIGGGVRSTEYHVKNDAEPPLCLSLMECDMRKSTFLFKPGSFHLLVCDMPYGIQHAPNMISLPETAKELARVAKYLLKEGGALAVSYNEKTIAEKQMITAFEKEGLSLARQDCLCGLSHYVEQAIVRNVLFAIKNIQR